MRLVASRTRRVVIVASDRQVIEDFCRRYGLNPHGRGVVTVSTNRLDCADRIRGLQLRPDEVHYQPWWFRGRYTRLAQESLALAVRDPG